MLFTNQEGRAAEFAWAKDNDPTADDAVLDDRSRAHIRSLGKAWTADRAVEKLERRRNELVGDRAAGYVAAEEQRRRETLQAEVDAIKASGAAAGQDMSASELSALAIQRTREKSPDLYESPAQLRARMRERAVAEIRSERPWLWVGSTVAAYSVAPRQAQRQTAKGAKPTTKPATAKCQATTEEIEAAVRGIVDRTPDLAKRSVDTGTAGTAALTASLEKEIAGVLAAHRKNPARAARTLAAAVVDFAPERRAWWLAAFLKKVCGAPEPYAGLFEHGLPPADPAAEAIVRSRHPNYDSIIRGRA